METQSSYWRYCANAQWEPSINICQIHDAYYICADLAGMRREDIDVQIQATRLVIRGQRSVPRPDVQVDQVRMQHMEIEHGPFCRELDLPEDIDSQAISARYKDGILWIRIPRRTERGQP